MGNGERVLDIMAASRGVISRRAHPELLGTLDRLKRTGRLTPVFPGVYCDPAKSGDLATQLLALPWWEPDAVVTGRLAAKLTFWSDLLALRLTVALPRVRRAPRGIEVVKRVIPPELVVERGTWRLTSPALTALDLSAELGGDAIDAALRSRRVTLEQLHEAFRLTPGRRGNQDRHRLLLDSRDEPWSEAERETHRLLRAAGIQGWGSNYPIWLHGQRYYVDVGFPAIKLAVEIDGRQFHTGSEVFESDRWRQNNLVLAGWTVLRFTWDMVTKFPDQVIAAIRRAMSRLAA